MPVDSSNGSFTNQELKSSPRQSSVSISFSTQDTFPMKYSSEIHSDEDGSSILKLPISPVTHEEIEQCQHTQEELFASSTTELEVEPKDADPDPIPNELSLSIPTSQSRCNEKNLSGQSPLSISSSNCFLSGMKLLIERGANINLQDAHGRTPLHLACNSHLDSHHVCIEYLLRNRANPNIQDSFCRSPLHIAAAAECVECVRMLINHNANPNVKDSNGDIPLHIASRMKNLEIMEALSPSACDESSSVESESSSILQFDNDSSFFFPRGDIQSRTMQESMSNTWNDSGYFTARGNAWTKNKYYPSGKIEEEEKISQSENGDSMNQSQTNSGDLTNTRSSQSLDLISRLVLYVVDFLLTALFSSVPTKSSQMTEATIRPEERTYTFKKVEPPDHVKEAMDRYKLTATLNH